MYNVKPAYLPKYLYLVYEYAKEMVHTAQRGKKNYLVSNAPVEAISVDEVLVVLWVEEGGELLALPQPLQVVQHNSSVKPLKANLDS